MVNTNKQMNIGNKIIYDSGSGFDLGYVVSINSNSIVVNLITGLVRCEVEVKSSKVSNWSKELELNLCFKYKYNSEFFEGAWG